jgi:phosphatidylglycerophosphate synthase
MTTVPLRRVNETILQPFERPALLWLAARMPGWVTPDILTGVGLVSAVAVFICYVLSAWQPMWLWVASLGICINWFGDSLDGTLARFRAIERPRYGFFIDHSVDVLEQFLLCVGVGLSGYVRFELAIIGLVCFLMLSVTTFLRAKVSNTLQIAYVGLGPTEIRLLVILWNAWMFFWPPQPIVTWWAPLTVVDFLAIGNAVLLFLIFIATVATEARRLAQEDPPRRPKA